MKHKLNRKRLSLNKVTVAHLNSLQMRNARGGCATETLDETTCNIENTTLIYDGPTKPSDNTCMTD